MAMCGACPVGAGALSPQPPCGNMVNTSAHQHSFRHSVQMTPGQQTFSVHTAAEQDQDYRKGLRRGAANLYWKPNGGLRSVLRNISPRVFKMESWCWPRLCQRGNYCKSYFSNEEAHLQPLFRKHNHMDDFPLSIFLGCGELSFYTLMSSLSHYLPLTTYYLTLFKVSLFHMLHRKSWVPTQVPTTDSAVCLLGSVAFGQEPQVKHMYGRPFRNQTPLLSGATWTNRTSTQVIHPPVRVKDQSTTYVMPETLQGSRRFPQGHLLPVWASHPLIPFPSTTRAAAILRVHSDNSTSKPPKVPQFVMDTNINSLKFNIKQDSIPSSYRPSSCCNHLNLQPLFSRPRGFLAVEPAPSLLECLSLTPSL